MNLIYVYPVQAKDIMKLLGCSMSTAYRKLTKLKKEKGKKSYGVITLDEFCEFYGIKLKSKAFNS